MRSPYAARAVWPTHTSADALLPTPVHESLLARSAGQSVREGKRARESLAARAHSQAPPGEWGGLFCFFGLFARVLESKSVRFRVRSEW